MSAAHLEDGWELVLLASLTPQRVVHGRVRANKLLAFLQLHGVPVPIRFRNIQMGPASFDVDKRAGAAVARNLLVVTAEIGRTGFERNDYAVTDQGYAYTTDTILPALQDLSYGPAILDAISDVTQQYLYAKDQDLVSSIHRELHLDDRDELITAFGETTDRLSTWYSANQQSPIRDPVILAALGTVDFALMAMDAIRPELAREGENSTGPYNVLHTCERLAWMLDALGPLHTKQHKADHSLVRRFDKILNALEVNCTLYGLVEVPTDEELDRMFEEAASFVPDPETS